MKESFSQRQGLSARQDSLQVDDIARGSLTRLWNIVAPHLPGVGITRAKEHKIYIPIYDRFLKTPLSQLDQYASSAKSELEKLYASWPWHRCLDFIEFICSNCLNISSDINRVLVEEGVGYRLVDGLIVPLTEPEQIEAIQQPLQSSLVSPHAKAHLHEALKLLSPRGPVNAAAVVREAINAVEAQAKAITANSSHSLGPALTEIKSKHGLHPVFEEAMKKLYGFTSDASGVRHAKKDFEESVDVEDALFFVIACSAFVSWLANKTNKP